MSLKILEIISSIRSNWKLSITNSFFEEGMKKEREFLSKNLGSKEFNVSLKILEIISSILIRNRRLRILSSKKG